MTLADLPPKPDHTDGLTGTVGQRPNPGVADHDGAVVSDQAVGVQRQVLAPQRPLDRDRDDSPVRVELDGPFPERRGRCRCYPTDCMRTSITGLATRPYTHNTG